MRTWGVGSYWNCVHSESCLVSAVGKYYIGVYVYRKGGSEMMTNNVVKICSGPLK